MVAKSCVHGGVWRNRLVGLGLSNCFWAITIFGFTNMVMSVYRCFNLVVGNALNTMVCLTTSHDK